jgi:hypothetical protein
MEIILIVQYIGISLVLAYAGTSRQIGFASSLIISLLLSPLAGAIAVFNSEKLDNLQHQIDVLEELKKLNQNTNV